MPAVYAPGVFRRLAVAVAGLALAVSVAASLPAAASTNTAPATHKLVVVVAKNLAPAAEKRLAVLVLVSQNGGAPAGAVATAAKPLTVALGNRGLFQVKTEIDAACRGTCVGSVRVSGSANHKLRVVPTCRPRGSGFVCSRVRVVKIY